jgi:hypothetical protein
MSLSKQHLKLISGFLEELNRIQANAGCNDFILDNTDENWALVEEVQKYHLDTRDWSQRPPKNKPIYAMDMLITSYLKHLVDEKIK